ncbi:unnamed protein product [Gongylonema pulchrum]|uniref:SAP30_Sin3_bdg domain-containing protein n=1 Tax=Gongylonema pulchrum TaxID=637853 RepID=A0A183E7C5_9BILA|nr:unnamed protein product [Gongylonema pulchrum]
MDSAAELLHIPCRSSGQHNMSASELCDNDDMATSLVVDSVLGFRTHKMSLNYRSPKRHEQTELKEILEKYIGDQDMRSTIQKIFRVKRVSRFLKQRTLPKQIAFRDHLLRFLQMFTSSSGFTVQPCFRYRAENRRGGMLVATKPWQKGDVIDSLVGVLGDLRNDKELQLLRKDVNDFSVMYSTRCVQSRWFPFSAS